MESGLGKSRTASVRTADKSKRDEWSEGGVSSLLDVYESKWLLRNRSKLKGTDWEEIAQKVSVRDGGAKPGKTPNQCKNKIESMKKRYRAESSLHNNSSTWQYYTRIDGLVKGTDQPRPKVECNIANRSGVAELESLHVPGSGLERVGDNGATPPPVMEKTPNCEATVVEEGRRGHSREEPLNLNISSTFQAPLMRKSQNCEATVADGGRVHNQEETNLLIGNGAARQAPSMEKARNCETHVVEGRRGQNQEEANLDDGSSTIPDNGGGFCSLSKVAANLGDGSGEINPFKRRKKARTGSAVADSIRLLAHSVLKIEQSRMEMYKDSERLRAEAEVRRAELDLKRTEIIAKTQLQIAKIFVRTQFGQCNGSGSSSSGAEPVVTPETEDKNG